MPVPREKECGKHFRFTFDDKRRFDRRRVIDFANREMSNVVLSLDGRKEVHDRYRVDYAGNGSWERIVPKFQKLVKRAATRRITCAAHSRTQTRIFSKTFSRCSTSALRN
mgnify:CR=1 FL=1